MPTEKKPIAVAVQESSSFSPKLQKQVLDVYKRRSQGNTPLVLGGKRLASPTSERKKSILGNLDRWVGTDLPIVENNDDSIDTSERSSIQKDNGHERSPPASRPFASPRGSPRKKSLSMTVKISKRRDSEGSTAVDRGAGIHKSPKPKSPIKRGRRSLQSPQTSLNSPNNNETSASSNISKSRSSISERLYGNLHQSISPGALSTLAVSEPKRRSLEESGAAPIPPPPPLAMEADTDSKDGDSRRASNTKQTSEIPESPSIRQRIALLQENLTTPKAGGARKSLNSRNSQSEIQQGQDLPKSTHSRSLPVAPFVSEVTSSAPQEPAVAVPHVVHMTKQDASSQLRLSTYSITGQSSHSRNTFNEQSSTGSPRKSNRESLSKFWQESTAKQNESSSNLLTPRDDKNSKNGHSLSLSVHSARSTKSFSSDGKEKVLEREMETFSRLQKVAVVKELIGRFSVNPHFKRGWEFEETNTETGHSASSRWSVDRRPSSQNQTEKEVAIAGLEELQAPQLAHGSFHSRDTAGTGTATYEEASVDDLEPINDSLQRDSGQGSAPLKNSYSSDKCSIHSEGTGTNTHEEASIESSPDKPKSGNISVNGEASLASDTLGAPYASQTPAGRDSFHALHESTTSIFTLHDDPFQLKPPAVFLDLGDMEGGPSLEARNQKAQVISDLEKLMERTKQEKQSSTTRRKKEKMFRDLLDTLTKVNAGGDDDDDDDGPTVKHNMTVEEVSDIVTHINLCEQTNTPIRWDLIGDIIFPNGIKVEAGDDKVIAGGFASSRGGKQVLPNGEASSFASKSSTRCSTNSSMLKGRDSFSCSSDEEDLAEMFRQQYNLNEEEMSDIIAHLNLCEETGTPIRWDLIHCIIHPEEDAPGGDPDDCKSTITDGFEDKSGASWFSIYPEFDDCASSVTFLVEGDEVKIGKKSKMHESINTPSVVDEV